MGFAMKSIAAEPGADAVQVFQFSVHVKSISVSGKCCLPPGRRQKCAPTFPYRLAQLSAPHPLLCPSGQLKRKNTGVAAKGRANCRSRGASPARHAKPGDAQLLPYLAGSPPFPRLALFHPHLPGLQLRSGSGTAEPAASAEPEEVWSAGGKRRRDVAPRTPRCCPPHTPRDRPCAAH